MTRNIKKIEAKRSKKIWDYLFLNQNKIVVLGQSKITFKRNSSYIWYYLWLCQSCLVLSKGYNESSIDS